MRVLVTGSAGFIGSHLAEKLAGKGFKVEGIDCFTNYYSKKLKELNARDIKRAGVKLRQLDLASRNWPEKIKPDFDYIYHLAAQPGISAAVPFKLYLKNNIIATRNLIEWALQNKKLKCLINISTSSVYGYYAACPETVAPAPASYYGATKLAAEQLVMSRFRQGQLPACSIRLYSVYGPRERPEKLYTKLIKGILSNQPIPLFAGAEHHSRSFTYVDDAVKGLLAVMPNRDKCLGEIINLGSDREIKTSDGIQTIERLLGKKAKFIRQPGRPGDQIQTRAVIDKAMRLLNYNPTTGLEEGLRKQVEWYKKNFCG